MHFGEFEGHVSGITWSKKLSSSYFWDILVVYAGAVSLWNIYRLLAATFSIQGLITAAGTFWYTFWYTLRSFSKTCGGVLLTTPKIITWTGNFVWMTMGKYFWIHNQPSVMRVVYVIGISSLFSCFISFTWSLELYK